MWTSEASSGCVSQIDSKNINKIRYILETGKLLVYLKLSRCLIRNTFLNDEQPITFRDHYCREQKSYPKRSFKTHEFLKHIDTLTGFPFLVQLSDSRRNQLEIAMKVQCR